MTRVGISFMCVTALALGVPSVAAAAVTNTNDSGPGSLRQEIADAPPGGTITVPPGTYELTTGELFVNKALTISGAGARSTIVTAGGRSFRVFENSAVLTLKGLTITGGNPQIIGEFSGCPGGGGICALDDLTLIESAVVFNTVTTDLPQDNVPGGGGIYNNGDSINITASTIANNKVNATVSNSGIVGAGGGGIMDNGDGPKITNSTIAGNGVTVNGAGSRHGGGGMYLNDSAVTTIASSTIAGNAVGGSAPTSGGNLFVDNLAPSRVLTIQDSIIANGNAPARANCDGFAAPGNKSAPTSEGGNLDSADECNFHTPTDKHNVNPLLGPLANNGGPTDTLALGVGSPAVDASGRTRATACPATDQRGISRPQGPACDIGSYEAAFRIGGETARSNPRGCLNSRGGIRGGRLGPAKMGRTRKAQRRILRGKRLHSRKGLDRYCVTGGGAFRIGYPTARMNRRIGRALSRRVRRRVVFIMTSSRRFNVKGIKARQRVRTVRRRLQGERTFVIGRNRWFVVRQGSRLLLVTTQRGIVHSVGIGNARLTGGRKGLVAYLRTWELPGARAR